ncbi:hypothetical protein VTJ83DRAFT_3939 [Remersonia thermophila]|uniref:Uncharacterized protein n=1 Tax=Remersonia thermophila TaxID=72144 RepID=A0ABR4DFF3_9PEZI
MSDEHVVGRVDRLFSFVEAAQADRERRENHTEDVWRAVCQYTAAADRKIADALGAEADSLLPNSRTTAAGGLRRGGGRVESPGFWLYDTGRHIYYTIKEKWHATSAEDVD